MRENIASAYIIFYLIDKINIDDTISATLYTETAALKSVTSICVCGSILFIGNIYRHVTHICVRAFIFYGPIRIPTYTHTHTNDAYAMFDKKPNNAKSVSSKTNLNSDMLPFDPATNVSNKLILQDVIFVIIA